MISRIASLVVAAVYLIAASCSGDTKAILTVAMYLILPLSCIWFSEAMGDYTGFARGGYIDTKSPGCLVAAGGWLLLLLPVIVGVIFCVQGQGR
jgi:hypothetical protein